MVIAVSKQWTRVRTLGRGASGAEVFLAADDVTGELFAVKSASATGAAALRREQVVMASLSACRWEWAAHGAASPSHLFPLKWRPIRERDISRTPMARPPPPPRRQETASTAMEASAMPGGAAPPSPLPPPARPLTSPRTPSHRANTPPPQIPVQHPVGRTTEQGGQGDGDLQASLVRVKLEAAAGSGTSSKKKGKTVDERCVHPSKQLQPQQ